MQRYLEISLVDISQIQHGPGLQNRNIWNFKSNSQLGRPAVCLSVGLAHLTETSLSFHMTTKKWKNVILIEHEIER